MIKCSVTKLKTGLFSLACRFCRWLSQDTRTRGRAHINHLSQTDQFSLHAAPASFHGCCFFFFFFFFFFFSGPLSPHGGLKRPLPWTQHHTSPHQYDQYDFLWVSHTPAPRLALTGRVSRGKSLVPHTLRGAALRFGVPLACLRVYFPGEDCPMGVCRRGGGPREITHLCEVWMWGPPPPTAQTPAANIILTSLSETSAGVNHRLSPPRHPSPPSPLRPPHPSRNSPCSWVRVPSPPSTHPFPSEQEARAVENCDRDEWA